MTTLAKEWEDMERMVLSGSGMDGNTRLEMKRAFFAGAMSVFVLLVESTRQNLSNEEGAQYMKGLSQEAERTMQELCGLN